MVVREPQRRAGRVLKRALAALLGLGVALLAIEIGVRVFERPPVGKPYVPGADPLVRQQTFEKVADPQLGYVLKPDSIGRMAYPDPDGTGERIVTYAIGPHGFRDGPLRWEKPAGVFRIAVLGDSFTYGNGVELEDSFPKALERALAPLCAPQRVEVMNCGVYSYNTRQEVQLLKLRVLQFAPDLVLITYFLNDVFSSQGQTPDRSAETSAGRWLARLELTNPEPPAGAGDIGFAAASVRGLRTHLHSFDLGIRSVQKHLTSSIYLRRMDELYQPESPGWREVRAALADARDLARERSFALQLCIYPYVENLERYPFERYHAQVLELCSVLGIAGHELLPALAGRDWRKLIAHPYDTHGNGECNRLLADYLAPRLWKAVAR
jgi:hypothetical protein